MNELEALNRTILLCRDYVADELSDQQIAFAFQSLRVLCVADAISLSSHSGQTALTTLVSLLSRMGMQVGLALPDVPIIRPQPPIDGTGICNALTSVSERLMPGAKIVSARAGFLPDIVFALGAPDMHFGSSPSWRMVGDDWSGSIIPPSVSPVPTWTSEWPIGAMASALLAANEAFKCAIRRLKIRQSSDQIFFEKSQTCSWDFGKIRLPEGAVDLGLIDVISAGAISQAALYALTRVPRIEMHGRVFDDDVSAVSNLNRNMLMTVEDVDEYKVEIVSARCAPQIKIEPIPARFPFFPDANVQLASRVLVGVDDIPSRWAVQREAPVWIGVSGTSHFSMSSSSHRFGDPCSGCLHPVDDPGGGDAIPTVSFVSLWAGLSLAVRLIRESTCNPYPADRQHLWLTPLRLDQRHAAMWSPVAPRRDCPVRCAASRLLEPT
jgi:hypothetical protein